MNRTIWAVQERLYSSVFSHTPYLETAYFQNISKFLSWNPKNNFIPIIPDFPKKNTIKVNSIEFKCFHRFNQASVIFWFATVKSSISETAVPRYLCLIFLTTWHLKKKVGNGFNLTFANTQLISIERSLFFENSNLSVKALHTQILSLGGNPLDHAYVKVQNLLGTRNCEEAGGLIFP